MKRLLSLIALLGITASVHAQYGFRIKNDSSNDIWVALVRGNGDLKLQEGGASGEYFRALEPGESKHQPINTSESTYVAVYDTWNDGLYRLSIVQSNGKAALNITPKKLYTFKKGKPIDVVWTGKKLRPKGWTARAQGLWQKGNIREVTSF